MMARPALLLFLALAPLAPVAGQTLLADLESQPKVVQVPEGATPVPLGQRLLFAFEDGRGVEPWAFDPAAGRATCLGDLRPGPDSSRPQGWAVLGSIALFGAIGNGTGFELWRTDGTPAGTTLVADLAPGPDSGGPSELTVFAGACYFAATDPSGGSELWRTDGTAAGTSRVADIRPGPADSSPRGLTVFQNRLWFQANDGQNGTELWSSDGTSGGTSLVADIRQGSGSSFPSDLTVDGGQMFFIAFPGSNFQLFVTDGTVAGLRNLSNLGGNSPPQVRGPGLQAEGGRLFFTVQDLRGIGTEPWTSDGTSNGTLLLGDLNPGRADSQIAEILVSGGQAWFGANDGNTGNELWTSDGTANGTSQLVDLQPGGQSSNPRGFGRLPNGNGIVFFADSAGRSSLWFSDGTVTGTTQLPMVGAASLIPPPPLARPNGRLVFFGREPSAFELGLWETDGSANGTVELFRFPPQTLPSTPSGFLQFSGETWFRAFSIAAGSELHRTSGTAASTRLAFELDPGRDSGMQSVPAQIGNSLVFQGQTGSRNSALFASDGTLAGTSALTPPYLRNPFHEFAQLADGRIVFRGSSINGLEPWVSDGTTSGTLPLADLFPGSDDSRPSGFVALDDLVLFDARTSRTAGALFATDGTPGGVVDISSPSGASRGLGLTRFGDQVVFTGSLGNSGQELMITDGTAAGTRLAADLVPGPGSSSPSDFTASGRLCFFLASTPNEGEELWVTDGSSPGTRLVRDLRAGPEDAELSDLAALGGGRIAFVFDDGVHGDELWISDGTTAGTNLLRDIVPGAGSGVQRDSVAQDRDRSRVFFAAVDPQNGLQPWTSDGTAPGTFPIGLVDAGYGPGLAVLRQTTRIDDLLFLSLDDGWRGDEPWALDLAPLGLADATTYGEGCSATGATPTLVPDGMPRLGNLGFAIRIGDATAGALTSVLFAAAPATQPLDQCTMLLTPRLLVGASAILGPGGSGEATLSIPNDPSLAGITLFAQAVVLNPGGALFGDADLSNGVTLTLGR